VIARRSTPCPFPVSNRLIYKWPVLEWPRQGESLDAVSKAIGPAIESILSLHPGQRGLIHTVSYGRSTLLENSCDSSRLLFHSPDNYDEILRQFDSIPDAVFCSPRSLEGLDLRYDRCRFIIFIKLPFLFLGDRRTKRRSECSQSWYALKAAIGLIQGAGRGVRAVDDFVVTYILDAKAQWWLVANRRFFPQYYRESFREFSPVIVPQ
jgi:ATP-dependent DNA helicase DinG